MKLRALAIAVAAASVPFAAQADFTVSGDITVGYFKSGAGATSFGGNGSEVAFDASEKVGSLTYFGHFEANVADAAIDSEANVSGTTADGNAVDLTAAGELSSDDMFVGVRGAFGQVVLGDTDTGCDATDVGFVTNDDFFSHDSGGCKGSSQNNITYSKSSGAVNYAVSYSPDVDSGSAAGKDSFAVGVNGKFGPATVSLGYESEVIREVNGVPTLGDNVVVGIAGNFGPLAVGIRANDFEQGGNDVHVGYSAKYTAGQNAFYGGIGDTDFDSYFIGYNRALGKNTNFIAEFLDSDANTSNRVGVGFKHSF